VSDPSLDRYVDRLTRNFKDAKDKHEAHLKSRGVLQEMSADPAVLPAIFRRHVETPGSFNTKHYPVVSMNVVLNPYYNLVANCWITLPGGESDLSTKAIHHHGDMLLTTATAFGPGYEHWTFEPPVVIDEDRELYALKLTERAAHPLHHIAFVDHHVPHLPMYPPSLSITLALWSSRSQTTWKDYVKRVPLLKQNDARLRRLARRLGLAGALDLKIVEYFDFYPTDDGFKAMKDREEFRRGPNEDYLYSLFHVLQKTGNAALAPVVRRQLDSGEPLDNPGLARTLLDDLEAGRPIEGRLSDGHYGIPFANFTAQSIEQALSAQATRSASRPVGV
jgi:hypothetical protein